MKKMIFLSRYDLHPNADEGLVKIFGPCKIKIKHGIKKVYYGYTQAGEENNKNIGMMIVRGVDIIYL